MKSTLLVHNPIKSEGVFNLIKSLNQISLLAHGDQMKSRFPVAKEESSVVRKSGLRSDNHLARSTGLQPPTIPNTFFGPSVQ
jgi:hypothetical protein